MELIWILTVVAFLSQRSTADYIKTSNSGTWMDWHNECTLATPRITYSSTELTVEIVPGLYLAEKEKIWVGYIEDLEVFRFYGCINQQQVRSQTSLMLNTSIGLCYSACNSSSYFGVRENGSERAECQCLDDFKKTELTSCNSENDRDFDGPKRLAVYERVLSNISSKLRGLDSWNSEDSHCFCYADPISKTFAWRMCNTSYQFLCTSNSVISLSSKSRLWKESADSCFADKKYPLPYKEKILTNSLAPLWLANVRSMIIRSTNMTNLFGLKFKRYGYIMREDNRLKLKFGNETDINRGLCLNGATDPYQKLDGASDGSKGPIGMYVGLPFAIVLVAVAVVISLVIRRKRRASPEKIDNTRRNLTNESNNIQPNQNKIAHRPDSAEENHEIQDITESTNEGYDTIPDGYLQKSTQNNNTDVAYFVLEKHNNADYEFANEVINETEHVYDTKPMNNANAITDDHELIGNGNTALKQSLSDQPYDTTCSVKQKYKDPTYDHTGDHISNNHTGYNADYDHTGDHTTYNHNWQQKSYSHNGDNTTYDRTGDNADYDHAGDRINYGENADYDHTGDNKDYDFTGNHDPYDHTGDHNSYDRIGDHAN